MFAQIQAGKEKEVRNSIQSKHTGKAHDAVSAGNSKRTSRIGERFSFTEAAYHEQRMSDGHQMHYYQEKADEDDCAPVQCKKSEVYKGGAELEYNTDSARLMFNFGKGEKWPAELLKEGIKGVSFDHVEDVGDVGDVGDVEDVGDVGKKTSLKGYNWNLTVELMGFNPNTIESEQETAITLELIVGGPTGTQLSDLPKAVEDASSEFKKMDGDADAGKKLKFAFDGQIFQTVVDHIIRHYETHAEKKMKVIKEIYSELYTEYQCGGFVSSYGSESGGGSCKACLLIADSQEKNEAGGSNSLVSSTIPAAPPLPPAPPPPSSLSSISEPQSQSLSKSIPQTVSGGQARDRSEERQGFIKILKLVESDLKQKKKAEELKETSSFSMEAKVTLPQKGLSEVDWGLQVTLGIPVTEIPDMIGQLLNSTVRSFSDTGSNNTVSADELREKISETVRDSEAYAPYLGGLAEIISAYRRGVGCSPQNGPKHGMRLVNKNPLDQVVMSMEAAKFTQQEKKAILETCVDMISEGKDGLHWRWEGADLSVEEWKQKMKRDEPVDLVSVYDGAYRHGQIGQLSSLNKADGSQVPVFEFRDLSSIKLEALAERFRGIVEYFDKKEPGQSSDTELR